MTDPGMANRTYIEPLSKEYLEAIIAQERPDALLPTSAADSAEPRRGASRKRHLEKYKVEMIGASLRAIKVAEGPPVVQRMLAARSDSKFRRRR
jgi:carbamoyl-phosphate synthase large subunit